jgi:hypothetical protein
MVIEIISGMRTERSVLIGDAGKGSKTESEISSRSCDQIGQKSFETAI